MAVNVENVHDTVPNHLVAECLFDWHGLDKRSRATVLCFNGALQLV